jgi:8-oxo-dGTP pyrophosphatase MutT (NUDIX family)
MVSLDTIRTALNAHEPQRLAITEATKLAAAVAVVLAGPAEDLSICFITRAEHPLDPWSGQMALPGGRRDPEDAGQREAAIRESHEEVGLVLHDAELLGELTHLQLRRRGLDVDGVLTPFVFHAGEPHPPLTPNHEVAEAQWIALRELWDAGNTTTHTWEGHGQRHQFPGIKTPPGTIWGLTYRVLCALGTVVGLPDLPPYSGLT